MNVLLTGAYGRCGTAIIDHLHDAPSYEFTYFDRNDPDDGEYGEYDTVVADVADAQELRSAAAGQDAMIHLAGFPFADGSWQDVHQPNIIGTLNALEAAREAELETVVFASSNHVMGMYEADNAPELYFGSDAPFRLSDDDPIRPDSYYGVSKSFGEALCRYYVENYEYPKRAHAIRICSVRMPEYDHPFGDAENGADSGEFDRDSEEYEQQVARMKGMWQSRRDFAHMIECCLQTDEPGFEIFSGVSDNDRRWYSIENAQETIDYDPQDNGEEWDAPPE
ncbi:epimerase (plasmid) [Halostagnicola larsenii XH-48]|uniref:Epimerase n=1 Tax=Halostagnicola larsenii XH-48 TaxID=797299 RepID=W0JW94_9EURY|nr:NAD(P)-dependent oxidoreductase [Halostagnicola larsenii]AHG01323.1 epimerase [Halostagnicola larsenii XH-48]